MRQEKHSCIKAGIVYLMAAFVSAQATNSSYTGEFNSLVSGKPVQAFLEAFTNQIGEVFWVLALSILFLSIYLRTQSVAYSVLALDIGFIIFWNTLPALAHWYGYILNFLMIANLVYRLLSPVYSEG